MAPKALLYNRLKRLRRVDYGREESIPTFFISKMDIKRRSGRVLTKKETERFGSLTITAYLEEDATVCRKD